MPQFTINFCSRITLFNVFFFTLFYSISSLTLGGGGGGLSSEFGVNEEVVPLLLVYFRVYQISPFFFIGSCFILFQS